MARSKKKERAALFWAGLLYIILRWLLKALTGEIDMKRMLFAVAALFFILSQAPFTELAGQSSASVSHSKIRRENQMKVHSIIAAPGELVNVTVSITNNVPVGILYMRMTYDPLFVTFRSLTPAPRQVGWQYFDADGGTPQGEIHISGIAENQLPMQPDSSPVAFLNFEVINQEVPPNLFVPICFEFRDTTDNTMYDSLGGWIDTNMIDYVCGSITLIPTGIQDQKGSRPRVFELGQNYPNPFNSSTVFTLSLPKAGRYIVRIYNLAGQVVKRFEGEATAGIKTFTWDGTDRNSLPVSSGIYFYKAEAGDFFSTRKMMLIK